ncbi:MAG: YggT family protein [Campylobacterota bacterium]|nr:YggT family protein [Campylobacterota bacterium]
MSIVIEIVQGVGSIALGLINVYVWVVIITALLSFVNPDPYNPVVQFLHRVTQPAYNFIRKYIKTVYGQLDLAPLFIIIILQIVIVVLSAFLHSLH